MCFCPARAAFDAASLMTWTIMCLIRWRGKKQTNKQTLSYWAATASVSTNKQKLWENGALIRSFALAKYGGAWCAARTCCAAGFSYAMPKDRRESLLTSRSAESGISRSGGAPYWWTRVIAVSLAAQTLFYFIIYLYLLYLYLCIDGCSNHRWWFQTEPQLTDASGQGGAPHPPPSPKADQLGRPLQAVAHIAGKRQGVSDAEAVAISPAKPRHSGVLAWFQSIFCKAGEEKISITESRTFQDGEEMLLTVHNGVCIYGIFFKKVWKKKRKLAKNKMWFFFIRVYFNFVSC